MNLMQNLLADPRSFLKNCRRPGVALLACALAAGCNSAPKGSASSSSSSPTAAETEANIAHSAGETAKVIAELDKKYVIGPTAAGESSRASPSALSRRSTTRTCCTGLVTPRRLRACTVTTYSPSRSGRCTIRRRRHARHAVQRRPSRDTRTLLPSTPVMSIVTCRSFVTRRSPATRGPQAVNRASPALPPETRLRLTSHSRPPATSRWEGTMWRPDRSVRGPDRPSYRDIDPLNRVFAEAFTDRYSRDGLVGVRVPQLNPLVWRYAIDDAGGGAMVWRDAEGHLVAFNMVHRSGSEGWIGPLAVRPDRQGEGLGSLMVRTGIDWLRAQGAHTIGLETMPRTVDNIGFYSRIGLVPGHLTVTLVHDVARRAPTLGVESLGAGPRTAERIEECRRLADDLIGTKGVETGRLVLAAAAAVVDGHGHGYGLGHSHQHDHPHPH